MSRASKVKAITVSVTGDWSCEGLSEILSGDGSATRWSLSGCGRYPSVAAFIAEHARPAHERCSRYVFAAGIPVYRFDRATREAAVAFAIRGPMADDKLPETTWQRLLGKPGAWTEGSDPRALDYVARDVHVGLAEWGGIPMEYVTTADLDAAAAAAAEEE